jgi:hypothetical protein
LEAEKEPSLWTIQEALEMATNWKEINKVDPADLDWYLESEHAERYLPKYFQFATERMKIFYRKQAFAATPWTEDEVLLSNKFTNCYRILDRISQYLIREIINPFWRSFSTSTTNNGLAEITKLAGQIYIFKMLNKIESYEAIPYHLIRDPAYNIDDIEEFLANASDAGGVLFSNAYLMAPPDGRKYLTRLELYMDQLRKIFEDEGAAYNLVQWTESRDVDSGSGLQLRFDYLRKFHGFGDFLAYQFALDFAYAAPYRVDLNSFVVPGPGCVRGMQKVFGFELGKAEMVSILKALYNGQEHLQTMFGVDFPYLRFNTGISLNSPLLGCTHRVHEERLALNDFQNLFCEFDKYSRVAYPELSSSTEKSKIKERYDDRRAKKIMNIELPWSWNQYPNTQLMI